MIDVFNNQVSNLDQNEWRPSGRVSKSCLVANCPPVSLKQFTDEQFLPERQNQCYKVRKQTPAVFQVMAVMSIIICPYLTGPRARHRHGQTRMTRYIQDFFYNRKPSSNVLNDLSSLLCMIIPTYVSPPLRTKTTPTCILSSEQRPLSPSEKNRNFS